MWPRRSSWVQLHENCVPGKGVFTEGAIGDFFGYHATAAERPPGKLSERLLGASSFPAAK